MGLKDERGDGTMCKMGSRDERGRGTMCKMVGSKMKGCEREGEPSVKWLGWVER